MPKILLLLLLCLLKSNSQVIPCTDYACDSLVVRQILDLNGLDTVSVESKAQVTFGTRINFLNFYGLRLDTLPPVTGRLDSLQYLNLNQNDIRSLPPETGALTNLTRLYIEGNQLTELPAEISNLVLLTELYLTGNSIGSLPQGFGNLTSLGTFAIIGNGLDYLPPEIGDLTALTQFYLSNNKLTTIPAEIQNLENLKQLTLSNNLISSLPEGITFFTPTLFTIHNNNLCDVSGTIADWINENEFVDEYSPSWDSTQYSDANHTLECEVMALQDNQMVEVPHVKVYSNKFYSQFVFPQTTTGALTVFTTPGKKIENREFTRQKKVHWIHASLPAGRYPFKIATGFGLTGGTLTVFK